MEESVQDESTVAMEETVQDDFAANIHQVLANVTVVMRKHEGDCMSVRINIMLDDIESIEYENPKCRVRYNFALPSSTPHLLSYLFHKTDTSFDCDLMYDVSVGVTACGSVEEMTDFLMESVRVSSVETLEQMISNMNHDRFLLASDPYDRVTESAANTIAALLMYE
jgi:hypothetical protein